jgi:hypothetical protein
MKVNKLFDINDVTADDIFFLSEYMNRVKDISPVKITIQLLQKLGFKKDSKYDWIIEHKDFEVLVYHCPYGEDIHNGEGCFMFKGGNCIDFKYLHQLQNLYFALTGEELEIK